jgi:dolichyl-phosphate-mannose-protein mannosyltransferase
MNHARRALLRRIVWHLAMLTAIWAIVLTLTGGFVVEPGGIRVLASRRPRNPAIISLLCGLAAWALSSGDERRLLVLKSKRYLKRLVVDPSIRLASTAKRIILTIPSRVGRWLPAGLAPFAAAAVAVGVVTVGLTKGAPYAGGADAYGYVSQADLWARGTLRIEQPFVSQLKWPYAADAMTPMGYRPARDGTAIVPIYPPGLPMAMAIFMRLAGRQAVFYVVPLLGGLAVWATYAMGRRFYGPSVGLSAAVLLATSPTFLFQLMFPMSDVPATAWWALALGLVLAEGRATALASGLAAGAAILTRPNLVPLAAIPGVFLLWRAARARDVTGPIARRAALFAAGMIPACVIVAVINTRLWGSPLGSGYDPMDVELSWEHVAPNLQHYPRWLLDTQTPVVLLALLAPVVAGRKRSVARVFSVMLACFIAGIFMTYLLHQPNDTWFWLRYLLPAFPPLFILTAAVLAMMLARLERGSRLLATGLVIGLLAWHGVAYGVNDGIFRFRHGEQKSPAIGEYIANSLPDNAVVISKLYSGSIRYYSGRLTLQYEWVPPAHLDVVVADLQSLGYHPYIALEDWEEPLFQERFRGHSRLAALDWPPIALLNRATKVKIYDVDAGRPFDQRPTTIIP